MLKVAFSLRAYKIKEKGEYLVNLMKRDLFLLF